MTRDELHYPAMIQAKFDQMVEKEYPMFGYTAASSTNPEYDNVHLIMMPDTSPVMARMLLDKTVEDAVQIVFFKDCKVKQGDPGTEVIKLYGLADPEYGHINIEIGAKLLFDFLAMRGNLPKRDAVYDANPTLDKALRALHS
jgi:hypothetical protein